MSKGIILGALIVMMFAMAAYALPTGFSCPPSGGSFNNNHGGHHDNHYNDNQNHPPTTHDQDRPHGGEPGTCPGDNRTVIPEPSTLILLGLGAIGMGAYRKIRK
jgi:hypothetical protein